MVKKNDLIRSSAVEYLTCITATGESDVNAAGASYLMDVQAKIEEVMR